MDEIVFVEKHGENENIYFNSLEKNLLAVNNSKYEVKNFFTNLFLPQGYPSSVSVDYLNYQIWDTAQAFCSTITGVIATQEVLRGVGVGDEEATPLAATITWIFKEGCGHISRMFFAYSCGSHIDAYSKTWRLYADAMNDAAMIVELSLFLLKDFAIVILCISTALKAVVGVAGNASRVALTQHHAVRGNFADISAKDATQETAVNLIASVTALLILTYIGNCLPLFFLLLMLHLICNYRAVRSVCLCTFNEPRLLLTLDRYFRNKILVPAEANRLEPLLLNYHLTASKLCGFEIKLGNSISDMIKHDSNVDYAIKTIKATYVDQGHKYMLHAEVRRRYIGVILQDGISPKETICAYIHAVLLGIAICFINNHELQLHRNSKKNEVLLRLFGKLRDSSWSRGKRAAAKSAWYNPSDVLLQFISDVVRDGWRPVCDDFERYGWDLTKNLLMADEWRFRCPEACSKEN